MEGREGGERERERACGAGGIIKHILIAIITQPSLKRVTSEKITMKLNGRRPPIARLE